MVHKVTVSFHSSIVRNFATYTNVFSTCLFVCLELHVDGAVVAPSFQCSLPYFVLEVIWLFQTDGASRGVPTERRIIGRLMSARVPLGYIPP